MGLLLEKNLQILSFKSSPFQKGFLYQEINWISDGVVFEKGGKPFISECSLFNIYPFTLSSTHLRFKEYTNTLT